MVANGDPFTRLLDIAHRTRHLDAGVTLFSRGDVVRNLFVVREGRIVLQRVLEDGMRVTLQRAEPGDSVAEASLFSDHYHCDAEADLPTVLDAYDKQAVLDRLRDDPGINQALMAHLARQVMDLRGRLELRNIRRAEDRLLAWLNLRLAEGETTVRLDGPLRSLDGELGLTQESVYRAIARLRERGDVRQNGHDLILHGRVDG